MYCIVGMCMPYCSVTVIVKLSIPSNVTVVVKLSIPSHVSVAVEKIVHFIIDVSLYIVCIVYYVLWFVYLQKFCFPCHCPVVCHCKY